MKLLSCLRTALCLLGLLAMPAAAAYPEKPINMIIAFTAGGSSDVQARIMQKYWNKYAPQPWVFVYKPGAGGIIGFTGNSQGPPGRLHHRRRGSPPYRAPAHAAPRGPAGLQNGTA